MRNRPNPGRHGGGFILIYVAAILVFLTALVLHSSREVRGDAQVSARLQERAAARNRLIAATILLQARQALMWSQAEAARRKMSLLADRPGESIEVDGVSVSVILQDADLLPDANQLGIAEWTRLLGVYGMSEAESRRLAERIDTLRQPSGGFQSIGDLTNIPEFPGSLTEGFETQDGERYPALADLVTLAGAGRRLHIADSPLALFLAFGATREEVGRLRQIRGLRQPTLADARQIFGGEILKILYDGGPQRLRVRLEIPGISLRVEFDVSAPKGQLVVTPMRISMTA